MPDNVEVVVTPFGTSTTTAPAGDDGLGAFREGRPANSPSGTPVVEPTSPPTRLPGQPIDSVALQAEVTAQVLANLVAGLAVLINPQWLAAQSGPSADALRLLVASQANLPHIS